MGQKSIQLKEDKVLAEVCLFGEGPLSHRHGARHSPLQQEDPKWVISTYYFSLSLA